MSFAAQEAASCRTSRSRSESTRKTTREQIQLHKEFGRGFQGSPHVLEAIRLRYRKRDVFEKDGTLFTVGFKVAGTGAKIKLDRVDRAGAYGIIDVATVFVDPPLKTLAGKFGKRLYRDVLKKVPHRH